MSKGYLERDYLQSDYGSGLNDPSTGCQVQMIIKDKTSSEGMQVDQAIKDQSPYGMQVLMSILDQVSTEGMQVDQYIIQSAETGMQVDQTAEGTVTEGMQADLTIEQAPASGMQAEMYILSDSTEGMQIDQVLYTDTGPGMQAKIDTLRHWLCDEGDYLTGGYLEDDYFSYCMRAFLRMQVDMKVARSIPTAMQVEMQIKDHLESTGMQTEMTIKEAVVNGMQVAMLTVAKWGMQTTMVIYNNTQLRFLYDFPSRGTAAQAGETWTMNPAAAVGDFDPNNLNSDLVEKVTRSTLTSSVELVCDTGLTQGVPVDTIAILNHNFTRSAIVQVQGSKNAGFSPSDIVFTIPVTEDNMYWISETLPTLLGQNRYWKFTIQDPTNTDSYLQVGSILFGASQILTTSEQFTNPIQHGYKHFKDELEIEGYTNIMNDRALKKWLRLSFNDLNYLKGNFSIIHSMLLYAKTNLKVLVIPTPLTPERYAVFAKLVEMPSFTNRVLTEDADYTSFELEWDESK